MSLLHDQHGQRKYLTPEERDAFIRAAESAAREVRTFCWTLAYSGCRISEALELTADRIDVREGRLVLETLKKRRKGVYRAVPVPPVLIVRSTWCTTSEPPSGAGTRGKPSGYGRGAGGPAGRGCAR